MSSFAKDAVSLSPPPACLNHPNLAKAFSVATATLRSVNSSLSRASATLEATVAAAPVATSSLPPPSTLVDSVVAMAGAFADTEPIIFTRGVLDAMQGATAALSTAAAEVHSAGGYVAQGLDTPEIRGELTIARLHPAWPRLRAALDAAAAACAVSANPIVALAPDAADGEATVTGRRETLGHPATLSSLGAAVEEALQSALIWAQGPPAAPGSPRTTTASEGSFAECSASLCRLLASPTLLALVRALEATGCELNAPVPPVPQALLHQLRMVLGMVNTTLSGLWAAIMHGVIMHDAGTRLLVVSTAAFSAYMADGFGAGEAEEGGVEDDCVQQGEGSEYSCSQSQTSAVLDSAAMDV
jgi:hypothetical protein